MLQKLQLWTLAFVSTLQFEFPLKKPWYLVDVFLCCREFFSVTRIASSPAANWNLLSPTILRQKKWKPYLLLICNTFTFGDVTQDIVLATPSFTWYNRLGHILGNNEHHSNSHVKGSPHFRIFHSSLLLQPLEDWRHFPWTFNFG